MMRWTVLLALAVAFALPASAQSSDKKRGLALSDGVLDAASHLPVLDEGRVKPLSTMAAFTLLRVHHKRTYRDPEGNKHEPMEWLFRALLTPSEAREQEIFLVANHDALDAIGLPRTSGKKRRDRYSYNQIAPARMKLFNLAHEYNHIDSKERTPVQNQVVQLADAVHRFETVARYFDFVRAGVAVPEPLRKYFDGRERVRVSEALTVVKKIAGGNNEGDREAAIALARASGHALQGATALALFPPLDKAHGDTWIRPADLLDTRLDDKHIAMLASLEEWLPASGSATELQGAVQGTLELTRAEAEARGEYKKIPLEISFYKLDPFYRALMFYVLGFLLVAATWIRRGSKWLVRGVWAAATVGLAFNCVGIVLRCILRSRPPVSTLYETVIFITAGAVLTALIMEIMNRRRIGLAVAVILGAVGMFISMRYEETNRADTMPQLVAVLDTNFWLATHVTTITFGYAAGLLAAAIAHIHIFGKLFGAKSDDPEFYRSINKMTYGILAFSLIFSVTGTILGGVWANDSWGRFWGWDPKENGALLIVLAQLAILHGRLGGYLRQDGIAAATIVQGMIVAFSWWGVNLLGVGLHSYGFTDGIWTALITFWSLESLVLLLAGVSWAMRHRVTTA